ncbi:MAG: gluconeogenesis factor YvcK family protein [Patescibacteria group bacterium]
MKKVIIIGGGTGIYPVTTALSKLNNIEIATIIAVSDSGGSTGRIKDEFGFLPVGDLRQSLAAVAQGDGQEWIRKLLLYRFDKGEGLKGHNLGNLILTALQDMTGSTTEALAKAKDIFRLKAQVIPATENNVELEIEYEDGSKLIGEDYLNFESQIGKKVKDVKLSPSGQISPAAKRAIETADYIIIGPGDYHASLVATLLPKGNKEAFAKSKAKILFIVNLMSRYMQTDSMSTKDYVKGIENHIGKQIDQILINEQSIPKNIMNIYAKHEEYPVKNDLQDDVRVIRAEVLSDESVAQVSGDGLSRSYLRHDSDKLKNVLQKILI